MRSGRGIMVKFPAFILIVAILLAVPFVSMAEVIDGIAAIVNDEIITSYEVDKGVALLTKEAEKNGGQLTESDKPKLRQMALNRLIDKKLIDQKIKELNITVPDDELRQTIDDVKKQNKMTQESLIDALKSQGLTFDQYQAQLREQLERIKLMGQEVRSKIQVSEKEIREYYNDNQKKYVSDEYFRARNIFFQLPKNPDPKDLKKVMTTAMTVLQQAKSGADFIELAKKYSSDPQAAKDGGDLGTFKKGDMLPEIEDNIINMNPGEISDLVITPAGFHIIKLEERIPGKTRSFDDVKGEIEDMLYKKKSEERFNQWLAELRKGAAIELKGR
ncbi:MAG TPA: peptidylprolyl isomerase [Geobacteraceae bacterium]